MDVTFDCYTYQYSGTSATISLPPWSKDGGPERMIAALKDPDDRGQNERRGFRGATRTQLADKLRPAAKPEYDGLRVDQIAEMRGQDPADALFDLLLEEISAFPPWVLVPT